MFTLSWGRGSGPITGTRKTVLQKEVRRGVLSRR